MTTVLDSSALLAMHIDGPLRSIVTEALNNDTEWVACAVSLPECIAAAARIVEDATLARLLEDGLRHTWDFLHVVPVDQSLLDEAAHLSTTQPVGIATALQLAAAARMPKPMRYVTFDASHIPVALSLGFDVVSG